MSRPRITTALAGLAAEERTSIPLDLAAARADIEEAFELADELSGETCLATIRECQDEARRLVDEHGLQIADVARALDASADGWIEADELRRVAGFT